MGQCTHLPNALCTLTISPRYLSQAPPMPNGTGMNMGVGMMPVCRLFPLRVNNLTPLNRP